MEKIDTEEAVVEKKTINLDDPKNTIFITTIMNLYYP